MTTLIHEDPTDPSPHERRDIDAAQPVAWLYVGGTYGGELEEWEIDAVQAACDRLNEASNGVETKLPLYTADQMRDAVAAEREDSERERDYLLWRMREIIPLFEEARDALCAISLVAATAYRVDLSLGARMDAAGTRTREEFDAMHTAADKEQPQ